MSSSPACLAAPPTLLDGLLAALRLSLPLGGDARADALLLAEVSRLDGLDVLQSARSKRSRRGT